MFGMAENTLAALGWNDRFKAQYVVLESPSDHPPGRVLRHDGASVVVGLDGGVGRAHLRPSLPPITVGDWVTLEGEVVRELIPRTSLLQRRDPSTGLSQPLAANIDIVGIVCGLDRPLSLGRIERFSTLAWDAGAAPLVILSKSDLVDTTDALESEIYSGFPGTDVVSVSSVHEVGVANLLTICVGKTLVLVGESGAGKSTLLNVMLGHEVAQTGTVRQGDRKGRHTTTSRELHVLGDGCCLIDTPGLREVGIFTDAATVDEAFGDIAELAKRCRFNDCGHHTEPGCAVLEALEGGELAEERVTSWRSLRKEAESAELRADRAAYRKASRSLGKLYRDAQTIKDQRR
jgi:ribosome biogenesis GTPase